MRHIPLTVLLPLFILIYTTAAAQKHLAEGLIAYRVDITPAADQQTETKKYTGTYIIYLKNKQIRKELKMNNGFENTMIFDDNVSGYLLKKMKDKNYAVQVDMKQHQKKYEAYNDYDRRAAKQTKEIAGHNGQEFTILYKDGTSATAYLSTDIELSNRSIFERFPMMEFIPLEFTIKNDDGMTMHFVAEKVVEKTIESGYFRVPDGYVVISSDEYNRADK